MFIILEQGWQFGQAAADGRLRGWGSARSRCSERKPYEHGRRFVDADAGSSLASQSCSTPLPWVAAAFGCGVETSFKLPPLPTPAAKTSCTRQRSSCFRSPIGRSVANGARTTTITTFSTAGLRWHGATAHVWNTTHRIFREQIRLSRIFCSWIRHSSSARCRCRVVCWRGGCRR